MEFLIQLGMFLVLAALIVILGKNLGVYGEAIAEKYELGHGWVGFILLATVTSFPELFSAVSATMVHHAADLAFADLVGSNAFNLSILTMVFFLLPKGTQMTFRNADIYSMCGGMILMAILGIFLFFPPVGSLTMNTMYTLLLLLLYSGFTYRYYQLSQYQGFDSTGTEDEYMMAEIKKLRMAPFWGFVVYSLLLVVVAVQMTAVVKQLAYLPVPLLNISMGESLAGMIFLAVSTSLPELAVSYILARRGNLTMCLANIFGSNVFNVFILGIAAALYRPGFFWENLNPTQHIMTVTVVTLQTGLVGIDLIRKTAMKRSFFSTGNVLVVGLWLFSLVAVALLR